jgi:guanyl-specific ribonuclease Sa
MPRWLFAVLFLLLTTATGRSETPTQAAEARLPQAVKPVDRAEPEPPRGVPEKALKVLKYIDKEGTAPPGYEGGRTFLNVEKLLPQTDGKGRRIKYREWDVNPLKPGVNRGPERLVTGSDNSAYYTGDHYKTFKKIR